MNIIVIVYALLIILFLRPVLSKKISDNFLPVESTGNLRGIMAIGVVLNHLSDRLTGYTLLSYFQHAGYLLVAVFFFLSGFGLISQYKKKGKAYLETFWKKRILFFVIILLIDTAIYLVVKSFNDKNFSFSEIIRLAWLGKPIANASWYLIAQICFYIYFWISFRFLSANGKSIIALSLLVLAHTAILSIINYPVFWLISNISFPAGVIIGTYKDKLVTVLEKSYWAVLAVILALFAAFSAIPLFLSETPVYVICRNLSSALFALIVSLLLCKIRIASGLWNRVGIISLEIYLFHMLALELLRGKYINISNDVLYSLACIAVALIIAVPMHMLFGRIKKGLSE